MSIKGPTIIALAIALPLAGCGGKEDEQKEKISAARKQMEETVENLEQEDDPAAAFGAALSQLGDALGGGDGQIPKESVDHKLLKLMLPEELPGMRRIRADAQKNGGFGIKVASAEAEYRGDSEEQRLTISIADIGNMSGFARMGLGWLDSEVDKESESGFERTGTYKGFRSLEKFTDKGSFTNAEATVFVGDRFIVQIDGWNVPWEQVSGAMDKVDLNELESLVGFGVAED